MTATPSAPRFSAAARAGRLLPRPSDWTQVRLGRDLLAGLMVALVALPLALGFGVSSGLGARAGIITAIVAGILAAVFGGSRVQVSGPTGAMTVVLVPIVAAHGPGGVLVVGLLAGAILLGLGYAGAGRAIRYVPVPVVEGFTLGIALIIALQQVPAILGVAGTGESVLATGFDAVRAWIADPAWTTPAVAAGSAALVLVGARFRPGIPAALAAVAAATVVSRGLDLDLTAVGDIPRGLPAPALPDIDPGALSSLVLPAVAVAALAALESLLSASVADAMSVGPRYDPDRELAGQGVANIGAALFGGVPATAAIARTAVNVRTGASSRLAAVFHSLVLLAVVLAIADTVAMIPLAALGGVLVATAAQMVDVSSMRALSRATRGDAATLAITAIATVLLDLVAAVLLGLVAAGFIAIARSARSAALTEVPLDAEDDDGRAEEERALLDQHIVAYRLDGPLFFAAAHDFLLQLASVSDVKVVILRMSRVTTIDATGASVLADTIDRLERRGVTVLLSGVRPEHDRVLRHLGAYDKLAHERHSFGSTPEAIAHARDHIDRGAGGAAP